MFIRAQTSQFRPETDNYKESLNFLRVYDSLSMRRPDAAYTASDRAPSLLAGGQSRKSTNASRTTSARACPSPKPRPTRSEDPRDPSTGLTTSRCRTQAIAPVFIRSRDVGTCPNAPNFLDDRWDDPRS